MENTLPIVTEAAAYVETFFRDYISDQYVYHNFQHTADVAAAAEELSQSYDLTSDERTILLLAAWFHDTGHDQGSEGHELRSQVHARKFLEERDFPESQLEPVLELIMATKMDREPRNLLEEILCDADYSHLGSENYWDRSSRVRQELLLTQQYFMPETKWAEFELEFMLRHRFYTEAAIERYGEVKQKNIKRLKKYGRRLISDAAAELEASKSKSKKKKQKSQSNDLKQLNLGRGVETMFRTTYRTHINLSSIADNKANIMLSINAIIISIVVSNLVPKFGDNPRLIIPTAILVVVCLVALVFAILSTRPKITEGRFTREDIEEKRSNLLFFGNFYRMEIGDFHWGVMEMIKDSDFLYSSMTRDLYYLGVVLARKYYFLRICYGVFMYGLILSVIAFGIALSI